MDASSPLTLDVREILRSGGEPFDAIMQAVASLAPGQSFRLIATFKPVPLFAVLSQQGFAHTEREIGGGDWEVLFTPAHKAEETAIGNGAAAAGSTPPASWNRPTQTLDNRGLQPPEPMVRTLETLAEIAPDAILEVFTDREPLFLYAELKKRGYDFSAEARGNDGFRILIRQGAGGIAA